ncbi:radial spoke head 10 homolog B-like isoform X2 [Sitophilus oryzae]|uniref:Radial spoke head 10 homolog B-like isoform X2 n=1 Tax=Sitophilus oryzae TaxID=7048 RepID=A0A6J2XEJ3_SITOR|nr:radial spoke head 10 homolog B-like isoform X2 [Sitophilus oryzae]
MDSKTNKHSARDIRSKHRSPKRRLSRSSKSTKSQDGESNSVSTSILKEQSTAESINMVEEPVHCREMLTNMFFDALLEDAIAEKKFAKQMDPNNLTTVLSDSLTTSQASTLESGVSTLESDPTKGNSNTNSSMIVENSSGMSCASDCMCCWKIIFKNGNIYKGQTNGNLMHGNGTFFWSNGCVYKGQFKNGYPSGRGEMVLPDLSVYDGDFCLGFFHGKGVLNINSTPIFYNGEWNTGQRSGKGWMVYDQNNWYDGEFINDMRHGYGFRQFKNGTKYKGSWSNDKINGEGCMIWNNNDYYVGKWSDGYQDGYGEYVWNLVPQNSFSFVNYNWYKGNWITGMRSGAGIMNFGYDNGARLAGTWEYNKKHGPGVIFCGNGITVEKDPLFLDDKPCTYTKNQTDNIEESSEKNFSTTNPKSDFRTPTQIYKDISQQINTKENLSSLSKGSISNILRSSINIKTGQYLKLLQTNTGNEPPLKIPIHNVIEEVDLTYFVDNILKKCLYVNTSEISEIDLNSFVKPSPGNIPVSLSCINYLPSNQEFVTDTLESSLSLSSILDMTDLKNVIIIYLPQLRNIYRTYAKLGSGEEGLNCEPILVRLFLWQLYRKLLNPF